MATITAYETKDGRRYRVRFRTPDHRQTDKRGFKTKRDAEAFAASVEVSKLRGEFIDAAASRVTIGQLGPDWLKNQTHLKPSAFRPLETAWRVHVAPRWSEVAVADVRKSAVQTWVAGLTAGDPDAVPPRPAKSATVVLRAYGVLASILDGAVDDRRVLVNPARGVTLPRKGKKAHVYLTHQQVHDLAGESKYPLLVMVLAYCGLRWGEAVALRVKDLDALRKRIRVEENAVEVGSVIEVGTPKNHKRRSVPYPEFLALPLARACEGKEREDLLFPGYDGGYMRSTRVQDEKGGWFAGAVKRADVPRITPHDLRHTAASLAVSAGANVKAVQRMLGHSSAAMTLDIYADLFDDDLNAVADRLNAVVAEQVVGKMWANGL